MKIAVTATAPNLDADIDQRFGRAKYILIVDLDTMSFEAIDNHSNSNAFKGAGIQTATTVSEKDAKILLTGSCGPNAFRVLSAANIKVVNDMSGKIRDCIDKFKNGNVSYANTPNAEGHM
jgi:predicted Fe-Mo cluster-binding NifX family protein